MTHDHEHESHGDHGGHGSHEHSYREVLDLDSAEVYFEAHTHDQTATVSMALCPHEDDSIPFGALVGFMQALAEAVEAAGGIVGHIKAFAKEGVSFAHASVTAAGLKPSCEGDLSLELGPEADIQLAAIVMLLDQNTLLTLCKSALAF